MIFASASRALSDLFSASIRTVFWKVIGLALLALVALWFLLRQLFLTFVWPRLEPWLQGLPEWLAWLATLLSAVSALGLAVAVAFLIAPATAIIAGFFLDDAAESIETTHYPADPPGTALPLGEGLLGSLRFFLVVVAANLLALVLLLVPGVNLVVFFLVNGYLIGREYFEFAASRHIGLPAARAFRRQHRATVLAAGLLVGLFLLVPVLNLLTPLFAAVTMVHLYKALARTSPVR